MGGQRHVTRYIADSLVGVETNPGPGRARWARRGEGNARRGRRGVGRERMRERTRKRHETRRERARRKKEDAEGNARRVKHEWKIVTWNLRNVSLREENRRRLRSVCERIEREGWEIVLVQELAAVGNGVIWLGEGENRVAIVHSLRAGIILRGSSLDRWIREGQQKWFHDRVVAVVIGRLRLVSVYQPSWGTDREALERCRRDLETQLGMGRREKLVIGGDFNANVGRNREGINGVYGRFGIGEMNEAGRDLMEWCGTNGLAYVNSYMRHERRGTWQHPRSGRWYELDGFLVRKNERYGLVRRMKAMSVSVLSDHVAKGLTVRVVDRRWRTEGGGRRPPRINWEVLQRVDKREEYKLKTRERMMNGEVDEWSWDRMTEVMIGAAKEVCGETTRPVANPWTVGREEEMNELRENIVRAVRTREARMADMNEVRGMEEGREERMNAERELEQARMDVSMCRRRMKRRLRVLEREWWQEKIERCKAACEEGRLGDMYKILKELGVRGKRMAGRGGLLTANDFKGQFERVSSERYEVRPEVIEDAVRGARDLSRDERAIAANVRMNEVPSVREIEGVMKEMRESAPGEDGVRISYIKYACDEMKGEVIEMVQKMFVSRANDWSGLLKGGIIVPLYKKGNREDPGNYRGVCLLAMGSRILARVIARRLGWWSEHLGLLDENQAGFRRGRSTADVTQMMVRIEEDVSDMKRRVQEYGRVMDEDEWPVARLLDLRKAYPRVNRPALWSLLERYGLNGECMNVIVDLHESTEYKVRANDGMSEAWMPVRGLREGCSTSPVLFNVYHQAVMRQVEEARRARGSEGVIWKWVPGGSFAGGRVWEKGGAEAVSVSLSSALFADDTSLLGKKGDMDEDVRVTKEVMSKWEESDNADKEEVLEFGTNEGANVRVLGSWMGEEDINHRKRRAGMLWGRVKVWLKGTCLSKRWQARVVEACVESSLLYDCQARVWYKRDMRKLQQWMDRCYRYVWSDRNGEPLRQMEERGVNMQDVRNRLGVKSVRWKIEKRVLERIGHVMRMGNERMTKAMVLGWYEKLEGCEKMRGKKKKTILYWKKMMKEAGWDWTDVERLVNDRKGWKSMIRERMGHLDTWERQHGHEYEWKENEERLVRNERVEYDLECKYVGCGKVCRNKAALTVHQKRIHRAAEERMRFKCGKCEKVLETEGARMNHERMCWGERIREDGRIECMCGTIVSRKNVSRHRRFCGILEVIMEERLDVNGNVVERGLEDEREDRAEDEVDVNEREEREDMNGRMDERGMEVRREVRVEGRVYGNEREREEEEVEEMFEFRGFEENEWRMQGVLEGREDVNGNVNARGMEAIGEERVEGENGNERGREEEEEFEFRGFEGNERRGRELNWFGGFGEDERRANGVNEVARCGIAEERARVNEEVNEVQADEGVNEIAQERVNGVEREGAAVGAVGGVARGRGYRGRRVDCQLCGSTVSYTNLARHQRTCRVWDPGGGPHPL